LDVIIQADDVEAAMQVTHGLGFSMMTDELPQGFVACDETDRRIDFHPVCFRSDGSAVQQSNAGGEWVFSAPGLQGTGSINGREIRCLAPGKQAVRATAQSGDAGFEPDATDRRDLRLIRERFGITLPHPFDSDPI
jgi:lincosamide nucleotidyltransferase A/C/D/E